MNFFFMFHLVRIEKFQRFATKNRFSLFAWKLERIVHQIKFLKHHHEEDTMYIDAMKCKYQFTSEKRTDQS